MAPPSSGDDDIDGAAAAVCCMCGDRGMPRELFRCKLCRLRLQHWYVYMRAHARYCSELYPRVTAYRRCNWCLREDGVGGSATAKKRRMSTSSDQTMSSTDEDNSRGSCGGCSRSALSAKPGKPVKKPKLAGDGKVPEAAETTKGRKPQAAAGKSRFKVKVRRYKLLAEVISC